MDSIQPRFPRALAQKRAVVADWGPLGERLKRAVRGVALPDHLADAIRSRIYQAGTPSS